MHALNTHPSINRQNLAVHKASQVQVTNKQEVITSHHSRSQASLSGMIGQITQKKVITKPEDSIHGSE